MNLIPVIICPVDSVRAAGIRPSVSESVSVGEHPGQINGTS